MTAAKTATVPAVPMTADVPKRTLTDQIIEAVGLCPGITANDLATMLKRDTAAVKGALGPLTLRGRLTAKKDYNGMRPQNRYYLGPRAKEVWINGAWRVME